MQSLSTPRKARVLVTGATGQVGALVMQRLANDPNLEVVAAARSPEKLRDSGVQSVKFDYDDPTTFDEALAGVERIFMVTGYTVDMLRQSKALIDHARRSGVKYVVHLGACGDDDTDIAHYGWHQFIERYIQWSGLSYTHLRPEIFMQNLLGYGGVKTVDQGVIRHYVGDARLSWIDCEDIATAAAACLREPEKHHGKVYRLGYDARTFHEVAEAMTRVLGKPYRYTARPPEEFLHNVLSAGAEPAYMDCVYRSYVRFTNGDAAGADATFDNFPSITGQAPRTLEDFIRANAAAFTY